MKIEIKNEHKIPIQGRINKGVYECIKCSFKPENYNVTPYVLGFNDFCPGLAWCIWQCPKCHKKAIPIEDGEWHCAGNFIQEAEHPGLSGKFEVFRDDEHQSHIGRYETFNEAKKAARENATERPLNGAAKYLY